MFTLFFGAFHQELIKETPNIFKAITAIKTVYSPLLVAAIYSRDISPKLAALYHKVETAFLLIDLGAWITDVAKLHYHIFVIKPERIVTYGLFGDATFVAWIVLAVFTVKYIEKKFYPHAYVKAVKKTPLAAGQRIEFYKRPQQYMQIGNYVTRITLSIALTALAAQTPLFCAFNVACLSYSLWKVVNQHWMHLNQIRIANADPDILASRAAMRIKNNDEEGYIMSVKSEYAFPLLYDRRAEQDDCPMCLESENTKENPKVYFCPSKSYHISCIPRYFFFNTQSLFRNWEFYRRVERNQNSVTVTYPSSIPLNNLPECPDCRRRETPLGHNLYFWVTENVEKIGLVERGSGRVTLRT